MGGKREYVKPHRTRVEKNTRTEVIDGDKRTRTQKEREALEEEMDHMLEDIDEVLEQNAEKFVRSYVQKGGE